MTTLPPAPPPAAPDLGEGDRRRAAVVAVAVSGEAGRRGMTLAADLQIWRLAGLRPPAAGPGVAAGTGAPGEDHPDDGADPAAVVGAALEAATDGSRRRAQGLHVTPGWLADDLVARAIPGPRGPVRLPGGPTVCDPACGGGAFLLAAARRLHRLGLDRRRIVRDVLWGADIDPVGLAAAEAVLALWAGEGPPPGRLVVADPLVGGARTWPAPPAVGFDAVVGNPPFQNQLGRATARSDGDRRGLRARYGAAVRAYTDTAWLFLLLGCDLVRPGGRVVLVQPQSVVAARDAAAVRDAVADRADLRELWLDGERVFAAAVRVCAPVLERRVAPLPGRPESAARAGEWGHAWAQAAALPPVDLTTSATAGGGTLGERAAILAGFRDQYYGLVGAVRERDELPHGVPLAPLVTSGALDWAACSWGERSVRYARRRWQAPVVDLDRLVATPAVAQRWVARCRAPKLVVGTQTRVVEAAVDARGTWVPSVPALAVVPHDPGDVWRLAAAVLAPAATAWLAHRSVGTALDRAALKVAKPDLAALPLPADAAAWDAATTALRRYASDPGQARLDGYVAAAEAAYGTVPELTAWWRARAVTTVRRSLPGQ